MTIQNPRGTAAGGSVRSSFIAAGSLVTPGTVIPPRSMVMGSPAKVRREVTESEIELINRHWQNYIEYKNNYMAELGQ